MMTIKSNEKDYIIKAASVTPSKRQLAWMDLEFCAFIHFGINTFTDREWGTGNEDPSLFNPEKFSAEQWVRTVRLTGMKGLILTCKHHDGFCLWPSEFTDHSVKSSPWKDGNGDVVAEVAAQCKRYGIKFGIYLSPWDMHETSYGSGEAYNTFFKNQLRELLTNYGDIFCVWFDGACGEGKNGRKQEYDWQGYYEIIRELQPDAVISISGPDVRWCGNEAGVCRRSEWSVVPAFYRSEEKTADSSQKQDNGKFAKRKINYTEVDLGSRKRIKDAGELCWYPAEVNTSIRPGWFYHTKDDYAVKSLAKLMTIYENSVGANASFLLNLPPTPEGLLHERDVEALTTMGAVLAMRFENNLADDSTVEDSCRLDDEHSGMKTLTADPEEFWHSGFDPVKPYLILDMGDDYDVDRVVIKEHVSGGQQIEKFSVWYEDEKKKWKKLASGTVIGHKRICELESHVRTRRLKLEILETRCFAAISGFEAY